MIRAAFFLGLSLQSPAIRDIHPPIETSNWDWLAWCIFLVLLVVWLLYYWRRLARRATPPPLPTEWAKVELESLAPDVERLPARELAARVSRLLRSYLGMQYGINALHQTTQEFKQLATSSVLPPEKARQALQLFEDCDQFKFTPPPLPEQQRQLFVDVTRFFQSEMKA
jgi:hypothetical protein